jgi:hypothetical protein
MKFSLDSAAKISEVIAAAAVIIGLLFVVLEIRANTVAQQFSATQTLVSQYNAAVSAINDGEFVCIYIRAGNDFSALSQADKIRYSILMQPIFRTFEQLHYAELHGTIDLNVYSGFEQQIAAVMQLPGNRQYWTARRNWFGPVFQEYMQIVIANSEAIEPANFSGEECG